MDSVNSIVDELFSAFKLGFHGKRIFPENLYAIWPTLIIVFLGGTNSFTSHLSYKQHGFRLRDLFHLET